jgi:tRNA nucleotidyltransferase/poly(A) polymerase
MADYIYLLQNRLTAAQQSALQLVRDAARDRAFTVFLVGGAVRDLTTGSPIRDLDFAVQGNALKLKKDLQKAGFTLIGEFEPNQSLHFTAPGGVRLSVESTLSATFPKPGKPIFKAATILDDLRRRDFTANAMAISLNGGSYGLLMDPLNGVADLENRELRLVSNYGFIEDPVRMVRAVRFAARLGWQMEDRTSQRYDIGKTEGYISALSPAARAYELEEIFHEEDPLRVLRRLEAEGWAKSLSPVLASSKANESELNRLRDLVGQFESMAIYPDPSAAFFPLLTAKLPPKDVAALKKAFACPGFADQIAALEPAAKAFGVEFTSKAASEPSAAWKLLYRSQPEPVLWFAHTTKSATVQGRFKAFFNDWSQGRTRIPYQLMQEMRIVPELAGYRELLDTLFYAIIDGKLDTPESARAFLEPFSPPAPPPPPSLRRRAVKREAKPARPRSKKASPDAIDVYLVPPTGDAPLPAPAPKAPAPPKPVPAKSPAPAPAKAPASSAVKPAVAKSAVKTAPKAPVKVAAKGPTKFALNSAAKPAAKKAAPVKKAPIKLAARKSAKPLPGKSAKPAPKPVKKAIKTLAKPAPKKALAKPRPVPKKASPKKAARPAKNSARR